ncbi:PAS domain-containing sensor histidine kinase [Paucibacter sp. B2R-40]|uniref:sensor histidine kinase n=1 Tax=Paucibacter sp. B2R-40 TaxID=2893554 RepID=UPI0021E4EF0A|nr:PAS domain-containing sensor histidine kinase [Paucibacter sp. B2R-40]MCV2354674.1 PAS domain-containing sensor histidine kinase [Paucibacter sp. B2R-40]
MPLESPQLDPDIASNSTEMVESASVLGAQGTEMLRNVLVLVFGLGLAFSGFSWWNYGFGLSSLAACSLILQALVGYCLMRNGRQRLAVQVLIWGLVAIGLGLPFAVAGVRTPVLLALPSICVAAGWLLGTRAAGLVVLATSVVVGGMVVAENFGYVPPNLARKSVSHGLVLVGSMLMALLVTRAALRSFQDKIDSITLLTLQQQQQLEALRLSEERFAALFRANPVPSSTVDATGRNLAVNDAWAALFGITATEALNKNAQELGLWHDPVEREAVMAEFASKGCLDGVLVHFKTANGVRPLLLYVATVDFAGSQRLVCSLLDQTDRLAAEAAQRAIHEGLEQRVAERTIELSNALDAVKSAQEVLVQSEKLASLGAMVAGISHELNTPIGNTVTVSSTLQHQVQEFKNLVDSGLLRKAELASFVAATGEMAGLILRSSQRAAELIDSFKEVAVDRASGRRRVFDLKAVVADIVGSMQPALRKANVPISIAVDVAEGLICDSYPGPLGQVLSNLVQNAAKHAFGGMAAGHIAISASLLDGPGSAQMLLLVSDDGVGMSEHVMKHAFDPFFTTRLGQGGSGLGLSVSHRLATGKLNGKLSVESRLGEGSVFTLRFAQVASDAEASSSA